MGRSLVHEAGKLGATLGQPLEAGLGHGGDLVDDDAVAFGVGVGGEPPAGEHGVEGAGGAGDKVVIDAVDALALAILTREVRGDVHDVEDRDGFKQLDLGLGEFGDGKVAVGAAQLVLGEEVCVGGTGGADGGADVAADELGGHLLEIGVGAQGVVEVADGIDDVETAEGIGGIEKLCCFPAEGLGALFGEGGKLHQVPEDGQGDAAGDDAVFDVVDGVSDVVRPVHDLGLDGRKAVGVALADPLQDVGVLVVAAVLAVRCAVRVGLELGVFARGVEGGAGEVKPIAFLATVHGRDHFGLKAGEDAQGLGVAFETVLGDLVEGGLAIMSVGRVADVVGKPGHVAEVRVQAQAAADAAGDLADLERVCEAGAGCVAVAGSDDLRFIGEAAQGRGVEHAGAVAGKSTTMIWGSVVGERGAFGRLVEKALGIGGLVGIHRG